MCIRDRDGAAAAMARLRRPGQDNPAWQYAADNFTFFKGFISGMYASNYDLTHVFIDSLCKIIPSEPDSPEVEEFLSWLDRFSDANQVKFTITISADVALATDAIKSYF